MKEEKVYDAFKPVKGSSKENTVLFMFLILCSLIFFIITNCLSIECLVENEFVFTIKTSTSSYFPIQMDKVTLMILLLIILLSSFALLCILLGRSCLINDDNFYNMIYSNVTKFVFIPILINGGLFLIGPIVQKIYNILDESIIIPCMILQLLSFIILIIVYLNTIIDEQDIIQFIFKKIFLTSLAYLNLYYTFYSIIQLIQLDYGNSSFRGINISFQIIMFIIDAGFIFFFKDVFWGVCCILTWAGIIAFRKKIDETLIGNKDDIRMGIVFLCAIAFETLIIAFIFTKKSIN